MPPSIGAGVREYCHNSYNGCFSKVEVHDFRRFLGYVLMDGYSWIQGLLVWVIYFVSPVSPTPDCITRKFREFISGNSSSLRISFRQMHDMRLGFDVQWSACTRLILQWSRSVLKSPWLCRLGDASYVMCTALYMMVLYDPARVGPTTKTSDEISIICLFRLILQSQSFVCFELWYSSCFEVKC